jgi:hypothetical protein
LINLSRKLTKALFGRIIILTIAISATMAIASVAGPSARADVRTLAVADPQDAPPTISGVPSNPDITELNVAYDTSGSIAITVTFVNSVNSLDLSQDYAEFGNFRVSTGDVWPTGGDPLCTDGSAGNLIGQNHIASNVETFNNQATIIGYTGTLPFTVTKSADGHQITLTASSPALANHNYTCANYTVYAKIRSTASNPNSDYDAGCDCWYVSSLLDAVPNGAPTSGAWFDGFAPLPPTPTTTSPAPAPPASNPPNKKTTPKPIPRLTSAGAAKDTRVKLALNSRTVQHLKTRCSRVSNTRMKCHVAFTGRRRVRWSGTATIWNSRSQGRVAWHSSLDLSGFPPGCKADWCSLSLLA